MISRFIIRTRRGQTAIEYLLLTTLIAVIFFVGFRHWMPKAQDNTQQYFNEVSEGIMGPPPGKLH